MRERNKKSECQFHPTDPQQMNHPLAANLKYIWLLFLYLLDSMIHTKPRFVARIVYTKYVGRDLYFHQN